MLYRRLGNSSLEVSVIAFGAWQIGDPTYWGPAPTTDYQQVLDAAIDAGINLFDTAEAYGAGESERALGAALGNKRDRVLIASKVLPDNCTPSRLRHSCEESLLRLKTDYIDLYQIHWPPREAAFADVYAEMQRLQQEGKIREIGVSNFGVQDLSEWMKVGHCVSNQLGYNLVFRAIEDKIVPVCLNYHLGILVYMPVLQGILSDRWNSIDEIPPSRARTRHFSSDRPGVRHGDPGCEALLFQALGEIRTVARELNMPTASLALAWVIAQPGITTAIIGARDAAQLNNNVIAATIQLDSATRARLDEVTRPLKEFLGTNADMWLSGTQSRIR